MGKKGPRGKWSGAAGGALYCLFRGVFCFPVFTNKDIHFRFVIHADFCCCPYAIHDDFLIIHFFYYPGPMGLGYIILFIVRLLRYTSLRVTTQHHALHQVVE
ncbi:hypothetical protein ED312_05715 [Sinomicrobium pectinilyticum]|uniref:Uncharacterized protein n=1 Tax=Sinomicrobium pectinilyticum TaxID=1084421 RepID=A0A3N0ES41_SINP1|nr:hypothetical protein ED312_05715 [Sinomicrobium pectinilyticum]